MPAAAAVGMKYESIATIHRAEPASPPTYDLPSVISTYLPIRYYLLHDCLEVHTVLLLLLLLLL